MAKRTLIITGADPSGEPTELGSRREVYETLSRFNTYPDKPGGEILHGPGIIVQAPVTGQDDIAQLLVTLLTEDYAWPVLTRICQQSQWQLLDPETGRTLSFG
ncbi:MAG: hypothetical protein ACF8PN_13860 [Phycisphaerales bacterium]